MPSRSRARRVLAAALLTCAPLFAVVVWWMEGGKRMFLPRNFGVVEPGFLYRSGQLHPRLVEDVLREHEIDVVVDLARNAPDAEDALAEERAVRRLGIRKLDLFGLNGSGVGSRRAYTETLLEIARARAAGERVLVHCAAGSERTGGAIALYRMLFLGWSGEQAWQEYLSYRDEPPHHRKLPDYLNPRIGRIARDLARRGAIEAVPSPLPEFGPAVSGAPQP